MMQPADSILIVGAGCFGVSTAYHLLQRGYSNITILDRSSTLPAPDAASNDINRVVRSAYPDRFYTELAREAISLWRSTEKWGDTYHESGVVILGLSDSEKETSSYADASFVHDVALGAVVLPLDSGNAIKAVFPSGVHTGLFDRSAGYLNREGGWANAGKGLSLLLAQVVELGAKVVPNKDVKRLLREGGRTTGVQCSDDTVVHADLVILAAGSWTPSSFPDLNLGQLCIATGRKIVSQCVAMMQLSQEEAQKYRDCPVFVDMSSGFYVFPMAMHSGGYTHTKGDVSTPRTTQSDPLRGHLIPKVALQEIRRHLRGVYPDLGEKPFTGTRLCWYNDSHDGDWVIGRYPNDISLVLATAGSGHAYKFLPVIGRLVADLIENKMDITLLQKFAFDRRSNLIDLSRSGRLDALELDLNELCSPNDFSPH